MLRNALTTRKRICVFAGPVFRDDDPEYRFDSKLPMRSWKIAVWADNGELSSVAVIADQKEVPDRLTNGMPEALFPMNGMEAVRKGDVRRGEERAAIGYIDLHARPAPRPTRPPRAVKRRKARP